MRRQARLDAPGALHHVMIRGIEGTAIFRNGEDREDFLARVERIVEAGALSVYAWALLDNHVHLLIRTGRQSLSLSMRRLLTGYVINFNRRRGRQGYLFQNRYKSILCEDDPYLLELTRYIHLNPIRAGIVKSIKGLASYPWTGHGVLLGRAERRWQDTGAVLGYFGRRRKEAVEKYEEYVAEGMGQGRRPELVGGGLVRSRGGWSAVLSQRRRGDREASDERILGSGAFVERVIEEAEEGIKEALQLRKRLGDLETLLRAVARGEGVVEGEIRGGSQRREVVRARALMCQVAVKRMGYSGARVARFLGVTTSTVNRIAGRDEIDDLERYVR